MYTSKKHIPYTMYFDSLSKLKTVANKNSKNLHRKFIWEKIFWFENFNQKNIVYFNFDSVFMYILRTYSIYYPKKEKSFP